VSVTSSHVQHGNVTVGDQNPETDVGEARVEALDLDAQLGDGDRLGLLHRGAHGVGELGADGLGLREASAKVGGPLK